MQCGFLHLLDYLIDNIEQGTVVLITSFNEKMVQDNPIKREIFHKWSNQDKIENIKIHNLDLSEIGEFIQYILGMSYKPLKFSAVMLKESGGNPRYIEYMMKDLYATGELFLHPDGFWEIKTKIFGYLFSQSMDEAMKNQISLIEKYMDIMKIVSIYNDSAKVTFEMLELLTMF